MDKDDYDELIYTETEKKYRYIYSSIISSIIFIIITSLYVIIVEYYFRGYAGAYVAGALIYLPILTGIELWFDELLDMIFKIRKLKNFKLKEIKDLENAK